MPLLDDDLGGEDTGIAQAQSSSYLDHMLTGASRILILAITLTAAAGCNKSDEGKASAAEPAKCPTCVVADGRGFTPNKIALPKGGAGTKAGVTFTRTSDETCAKDVVVPELKIKEELPLNKPVTIQIPTDEAKTLTFQCGMGMYKSSIVVN